MYKSLIFIFQFLIVTLVSAQDFNKTVIDSSRDQEILIGDCNAAGLIGKVFGGNFIAEYDNYIPDRQYLSDLTKYSGTYNIIIVLASWCSDTREQLPRFLKIIDFVAVPEDAIRMIAVDRNKSHGELFETPKLELNIERVPTFIIISNGKEVGRIIETPEVSLEADLLKILEKL